MLSLAYCCEWFHNVGNYLFLLQSQVNYIVKEAPSNDIDLIGGSPCRKIDVTTTDKS